MNSGVFRGRRVVVAVGVRSRPNLKRPWDRSGPLDQVDDLHGGVLRGEIGDIDRDVCQVLDGSSALCLDTGCLGWVDAASMAR